MKKQRRKERLQEIQETLDILSNEIRDLPQTDSPLYLELQIEKLIRERDKLKKQKA